MKPGLFAFTMLTCVIVCRSQADETTPIREPLYHESLRPQFHFTARYWDDYQLNPPNHHEGWINDINGLVYNDGVYHFFAQRWWSAWLHAVSTDLIHWKELRPAFGKVGRFGGTQYGGGVVDWNNSSGLGDGTVPPMIAFWGSTDNLNQCISYSLDQGQTWSKYDKNPVLIHKYRDPKVFWYEPDKKWIMILYGPSDELKQVSTYGFNGENNDAHDLMEFSAGQWMSSAIRLYDNGTVIATDQHDQRQARIDITKQNIGSEIFSVGAKANQTEYFEGDIAEILVYNRTLSDDETQHTIAGLQSKWGLSESQANYTHSTEGLILHLDATDLTTDDEGMVACWKDLSGQGHSMTASALDRRPRLIRQGLGNHPVVRFEGTQCLQSSAVLADGDDTFTIIALWRRNSENGSQVVCEQNAKTQEDGRRASLLTVFRDETENVYLLFSSTNLLDWTQLDTCIPNSYECPDMFQLPVVGDGTRSKWIVIDGNGDYVLGQFDGKQFTPESQKRKGDYGRNFYATMTFENMPKSDPRRIQLAWMRGWNDYPKTMPFNQQISFPCELTLHQVPEGIAMYRYPIREISQIYDQTFTLENYLLQTDVNPLSHWEGELIDLDLKIDLSQSTCSRIEITLRGNTVTYDVTNHILESVGSKVTLEPRNGQIEIRILMDRLSIETLGNRGEVSITNIAYQQDGSPHLSLHAVGGAAKVISLTRHSLKSICK